MVEKLVKHHVHSDCICVQAIDSRRIDDVVAEGTKVSVEPTQPEIREEPPEEIEKMWPRKNWKAVPDGFSRGSFRRLRGPKADHFEILDRLRIDVNFGSWLQAKALDLLHHAAFSAVVTVQERRDDGNSQISPARPRDEGLVRPPTKRFAEQGPVGGTIRPT